MSTSPNSPRKWRKSIFGFGINWPPKPPPASPECRQKRHNSVSFAPSPPPSPASRGDKRARGYSTQSWRATPTHHGSVQSLVIRQKIQRKSSMNAVAGMATGGGIIRRPSTPSLPFAIVQAVTGRLRQGSSTLSLDEEDSAFCSGDSACCSSASLSSSPGKRNSGMSTLSGGGECGGLLAAPLLEWTSEERVQIEREFEERCGQSIGHQFVKNYKKLAWANLPPREGKEGPVRMESDDAPFCAEGNVQFHLLSMVAPPGKRVVNVGRSSKGDNPACWFHLSPSLRPYNPNSLKLK